MITRVACLLLLLAWGGWGLYLTLTDGFGEEGGGKFALMGLFGLAVVLLGSFLESRSARKR